MKSFWKRIWDEIMFNLSSRMSELDQKYVEMFWMFYKGKHQKFLKNPLEIICHNALKNVLKSYSILICFKKNLKDRKFWVSIQNFWKYTWNLLKWTKIDKLWKQWILFLNSSHQTPVLNEITIQKIYCYLHFKNPPEDQLFLAI